MNTKETNPPAVVTTLDRFETWFKANHHTRLDRKMADGSYNDPTAYAMWQAWQAGSIDVAKAVNAQQAERIKELEAEIITRTSYGDEQTDFAIKLAVERDALRAQLAAIDAAEPVCLIPDYELDYMQTHACGAVYKIGSDEAWDNNADIKLFTRPMPAQPIIGLQDVHDAITADPTLAQPNIQNQIIKDISEKPCHACAHYQQGKRPGVSIHDETCYGCSEYYTNKWEAA